MGQTQARLTGATETADLQRPLVTVVIVNHNYARFLKPCIRSVDQQDYPNLQCIVVDCASSDDSLAVIEEAIAEARNPFFQLIRRETNHGHLLNAMTVLEVITGVFVAFLDADDFLFPEFVSTHVKAQLNDLNSAAVSVTDLIQVDAAGQVIAGKCHWHQKWRAFEQGSAWTDLKNARSWAAGSSFRMEKLDIPGLFYVPAWWSSWLPERWIWSATSALMFRKTVIERLAPSSAPSPRPHFVDAYFARFAHSVGGTLVIDSTQGAYRRHGNNFHGSLQILGGQTPTGSSSRGAPHQDIQRLARETLVTKYRDLVGQLGRDLYYSIAWQLMSNEDFLKFARGHEEDRATWEKTIKSATQPPALVATTTAS